MPSRVRERAGSLCCSSQGCVDEVATGSRFCSEHQANLARIRAELQAEIDTRGTFGQRSDRRKSVKGQTCMNPNCWEYKLRNAWYCDGCSDAGWVDEKIPSTTTGRP